MPKPQIDTLRKVPGFSGLDEESLKAISDLATEFQAEKGRVLIERGQPGTGLFLIEEGSVRVDMPSGKSATLGSGDFFGELAVFADVPRTARVSVTAALTGLAISRRDLLGLLREEPSIAITLLQQMAKRLAAG
ncbi:MAG: cyclic nucleotide-binding domain-containing protein [Acidimicrobiia bacterium]